MYLAALTLATIALTPAIHSAIVGVPAGVDNPFAVELPTESDHTLAARSEDPLEYDGWCSGNMHCCLIADRYSRCHSVYTPCSKLSFPDALSAPAPHLPPKTISTLASFAGGDGAEVTIMATKTRAVTTVTVSVESASAAGGMAAARISDGLPTKQHQANPITTPPQNVQIVTEVTVQVTSVTATTVVPVLLSPIPSHTTLSLLSGTTDSNANTTAANVLTTLTNPLNPTQRTVGPASITPSNNASIASGTWLNISSFSMSSTPSTSLNVFTTSGVSDEGAGGSELDGTTKALSTVTRVSITTTGTTTAGLAGEPSAIASGLGQSGAAALSHDRVEIGVAVLVGLGVVAAAAVMV